MNDEISTDPKFQRSDCVRLTVGARVISTFDYGKHNPLRGTIRGWYKGPYAPGFYAVEWDGSNMPTLFENCEPHDDLDVEEISQFYSF